MSDDEEQFCVYRLLLILRKIPFMTQTSDHKRLQCPQKVQVSKTVSKPYSYKCPREQAIPSQQGYWYIFLGGEGTREKQQDPVRELKQVSGMEPLKNFIITPLDCIAAPFLQYLKKLYSR